MEAEREKNMIILDYKERRPIYEQIVERFQELMVAGVMEKDTQLPSVRNLAMDLSINPNTIQRAYAELERQGYTYSVKGKGNFVADNSNIKESKKKGLYIRQEELAEEGLLLGVKEDQLVSIIHQIYGRE